MSLFFVGGSLPGLSKKKNFFNHLMMVVYLSTKSPGWSGEGGEKENNISIEMLSVVDTV